MKSKEFQNAELLLRLLEGDADDSVIESIQQWLDTDPQAGPKYLEFINNYAAVKLYSEMQLAPLFEDKQVAETGYDQALLKELAEMEQNAPRIDHTDEQTPQQHIRNTVRPKLGRRKVSRFEKIIFTANIAALLFIMLFVKFYPAESKSIEVATVIDQIDARWAQSDKVIANGFRLSTNSEPLKLEKGIITFRYDEGVDVVIEAPALFKIDQSRVILDYGRLFSAVSNAGLGFTVKTPTSQFVDLGTEFGVQADINGSSELHVIKGKVQLFAGAQGNTRSSVLVTENNAVRYDAESKQTKDIPVKKKTFVRGINSDSGSVWRGEAVIDLADIVGGGNGFGTGIINSGIETGTGRRFLSPDPALEQSKVTGILKGSAAYNVVSLPLIDGVFVPDSRNGAVQVTSAGHLFDGFTEGREVFWGNIFNGAWHASDTSIKHSLKLNGQTYGTAEHPAISLHSNQGITFDLQAIRKMLPRGKITVFTSRFGVSETVALDPSFTPKGDALNNGEVNCWVLIDGKAKYNRNDISYQQGAIEIEIEIAEKDRFLTLVVTEAGDRRAYDWALFAEPRLSLDMSAD
ncbi:MAG: NPCBM/NEW2 domain-containing protein [Phycisphaerae bacterium]